MNPKKGSPKTKTSASLAAAKRMMRPAEGDGGYSLFTMDSTGVVNSWNPGSSSVFGWTEPEILGRSFEVLFTPEDRNSGAPRAELRSAARKGSAPDVRWHLRKDGRQVFIRGAVHPIEDDAGELHGFIKIGRDLTAQRLTKIALEESEAKYAALFTTIDEGFIFGQVTDVDGILDFVLEAVNPAFERLAGVESRHLLATTMRAALPDLEEVWYELLGRSGLESQTLSQDLYSRSLGQRWFSVRLSPFGAPTEGGVALALTDITERKQHEAELAFLAEISQDLAQLVNIQDTLDKLTRKIGEFLSLSDCVLMEVDDSLKEIVLLSAWNAEQGTNASQTYRVQDFATPVLLAAVREGRPIVLADGQEEHRVQLEALTGFGIRALLALPLFQAGPQWLLFVFGDSSARSWTSRESEIGSEAARRIWSRLQRLRADEALRAKDEQHRLMLENVRDYALFTLDPEGRVTSWNAGLGRLTGYERNEILGQHFRAFYPPAAQEAGKPEEEIKLAIASGRVEDEGWWVRKDGTRLLVHEVITPARDRTGKLTGFVKIARDVTEQKLVERERREREQETALLAERHRMAQELHDTLAQGFIGIKLQMDMAEYELEDEGESANPKEALRYIVRAREFALQSQVEARRSIRALRSPMVDNRSLTESLEQLVKEVSDIGPVTFETVGTALALGAVVQHNVYRIVQEALTNALRHSGAELIAVRLAYAEDGLVVSVTDNGRGFDPKSTPSRSFGIMGMQERAERIRAKFRIVGRPGRGCDVVLALGVDTEEAREER